MAHSFRRWLLTLGCFWAFACKSQETQPPKTVLSQATGPRQQDASPPDTLFADCKTPEERWERFRERIEHPGSDQELFAVFASVMVPGPSALPFGQGDWWRRWSDLARSSKDQRVRALFSQEEWRVHHADTAETQLFFSSEQVGPGEQLRVEGQERRIHLQRTRMRLGVGLGMEPTAEVDSIWLERDSSGKGLFSRPMMPGLWRLTTLNPTEFVERIVSIADRSVLVLPTGEALVVIAERVSKVHLFLDSAWSTFSTDSNGFFRYPLDSLLPDSAGPRSLLIVVEDSVQVFFDEVLLDGHVREDKILGFVWTDRTTAQKGERIHAHGFVRAFDRMGVPRKVSGLDSIQLYTLGPPRLKEGFSPIPIDRNGHFQSNLRVSDSTPPGELSFVVSGLDNLSDGGASRRRFEVIPGNAIQVAGFPEKPTSSVRRRFAESKPSMHFCFDRQAHVIGDTAPIRVGVMRADGSPARTKVQLELLQGRVWKDTVFFTDHRGFATWMFPAPPKEGAFEVRAQAVIDGVKLDETSRLSWSHKPSDVPFVDAAVRLHLDKDSYRAGENAQIKVESAWEGAAVAVFPSGRKIGEIRWGRIANGSATLTCPISDLGIGLKLSSVVMGPKGRVWVDTALERKGGGFASVTLDVERRGLERDVELVVAAPNGRKLSSILAVKVSNRPRSSMDFRSMIERLVPAVADPSKARIPFRFIESWSKETMSHPLWRWSGMESRPMKKPRNPCPGGDCPMEFSSSRPWDFKPDRFRNCGVNASVEEPLPAEQVVYWNDQVETGWFKTAKVRFRLPDQGGPWFLEVRGTAGENLLVDFVGKL
ncbi:MAG: hypothetical protein IPN71_17175 [Fibrobacteres bacterium]|nr:hypothetical protein [Fibrobacterota bacterium]